MEVKRVKKYENPKFSTFQLKTGKTCDRGCLFSLAMRIKHTPRLCHNMWRAT